MLGLRALATKGEAVGSNGAVCHWEQLRRQLQPVLGAPSLRSDLQNEAGQLSKALAVAAASQRSGPLLVEMPQPQQAPLP